MATIADDIGVRNRLHRIEGQIRGLQRMIDQERPLSDTLIQVAAVRAALAGLGRELVHAQARGCAPDDQHDLDELIRSIDALIGHG